ncbi:PH, RCC1 and FYVE domains-containing protein 1 isoform X1 [Tanacetum coccineum]
MVQGIMLDGVWNTDPKDIKLAFLDFYKDKFSCHDSPVSFLPMLSAHRLSIADWDFLKSMVSMDEIKAAVWDCGSQKAPGPDDYSFMFIKNFLDLLKHDIPSFVVHFFSTDPYLIGNHYKIVAILANRLSKVIDSIISPEKSALITGHQNLYGPLILSETIDCWRYLDYVLDKLGFGIKWRNWIKAGLSSARTSILINGSPTSKFSLKRGLKQGDPLSPFLFIIVTKGLYMALNDGLVANMFHGVKVGSPVGVSSNEVEIMASYMGCEAGFSLSLILVYLLVPETVVKSLKSLRASFFWSSSEDSKKLAWVKWSSILASLDKGGPSVGSLKAFNMSLLLKWRWRLFHNPNALWVHVVKAIHGDEAGRTKAEFDALISKIASLEPEELFDSDTCIWSLSHDDKFLVNSVRKHIDELSLISLSPSLLKPTQRVWDGVAETRKELKDSLIKKEPGHSFIEIYCNKLRQKCESCHNQAEKLLDSMVIAMWKAPFIVVKQNELPDVGCPTFQIGTFHGLEKSLKSRFIELENQEKEFKRKTTQSQQMLKKRQAAVMAKEEASLMRLQEKRDAAVVAIANVPRKRKSRQMEEQGSRPIVEEKPSDYKASKRSERMTDLLRTSYDERNVGQAIASLKRGTCLLKYGRRGKPKFCPFRLSNDETTIIWYVKMKEKQLRLSNVSKIIAGQRTANFQRYPRPEKEYQSFSLIYGKRSLDVICKDKDEAENWFAALRALISRNNSQNWRSMVTCDGLSSDASSDALRQSSQSIASNSSSDVSLEYLGNNETLPVSVKKPKQKTLGRAFSDLLFYTGSSKCSQQNSFVANSFSLQPSVGPDDQYACNCTDSSRLSISSSLSSSSQESYLEDFESLKDVFIWGEGIGDGFLGGGVHRIGSTCSVRMDALLPKALKSTTVLNAQKISCGSRHAVLVTKHGFIYSWGEGSCGRLGHGVESDVSTPQIIDNLIGLNTESIACGENHTCAVTQNGDLYTWGDGIHHFGLLGHESGISYWTPRKVGSQIEGMRISSVSCGPWHTAAITSEGILFTFGDGTFGALGHGDTSSTYCPKIVEALKGLYTQKVDCGVWHTAAIVEIGFEPSSFGSVRDRKIFTWGNGDKGQLGHYDKDPRFVPSCVLSLYDKNFCQVACGSSMTVALTTSGQVYMMGGPESASDFPLCVEGLKDDHIKEIACGSHHVVVLNSKFEVYTWGKGANGQLGHGDRKDTGVPTLVEALSDKRVKSVACGSNFTVALCLQKRVSTADLSMCSGCHEPFNFRRQLHNCYNCGSAFCNACSSKKSLKALLAPDIDKPYRVCDDCHSRLNNDKMITSYPSPKVGRCKSIDCKSGKIIDLSSPGYKLHGPLSRFSFASSEHLVSPHSKCERSNNCTNDHALSQHNGNPQREYAYMPCISSTSPTAFEYSDRSMASHPNSTVGSQEASTVSLKSSPDRSALLTCDAGSLVYPEISSEDYIRINEILTEEVSTLREQVDVFSHKVRLLEAELERKSRQLKEATEQARDQGVKNQTTKEVIQSLTIQMTWSRGWVKDRLPPAENQMHNLEALLA